MEKKIMWDTGTRKTFAARENKIAVFTGMARKIAEKAR